MLTGHCAPLIPLANFICYCFLIKNFTKISSLILVLWLEVYGWGRAGVGGGPVCAAPPLPPPQGVVGKISDALCASHGKD